MLDRVAKHAYALCLTLAAVTLGLAPLHQWGVQRANVDRLRPDARIELRVSDSGLQVGELVPLYRFNPGWMQPIGQARVEQVDADRVVAHLVKPTFRWPPGRQGRVVGHDRGVLEVNVGTDIGWEVGHDVQLFDGRQNVARAVVTAATASSSTLTLDGPGPDDLVGATATRFQVADQVAWFRSPAIALLEVLVIAGALGAWAVGLVDPRPGAWVARQGARLRAAWPREGPAYVALQALWGLAVVGLFGQVLWYSVTWIAHHLSVELTLLDLVRDPGWPEFTDHGVAPLWIVGGVCWAGWLAVRRTSPGPALWLALRWRPLPWSLPFPRGWLLWVLHLAIAYAFASTLWGFLNGNLAALRGLWPVTDLASFYEAARYTLWSATICGCLLGYGHTVLSILWKPDGLKHLDFTPMGWFTNAICYYPLLGAAFLHAFPPLHGHDPVLVGGPLAALQPATELLLNLCYTLSIWNLGTMFGVMADKGVRTSGFYSVVRHPSYTLEALMFMVMYLNGASAPLQWLAASSYLLKYWLRSEREDQFMALANPDYTPYRDKVAFKFVPGIY